MLEIDGSFLEGGGQILRTAIALSAVLNKDVKVVNIRSKRKKPGLKPQHFASVNMVAKLTGAEVEGLRIGSKEIVFKPKTIKGGSFIMDIGTAGSVTLVLQTLLPFIIYAPTKLNLVIRGGTNVAFSPQVDYFINVFTRWAKSIGVEMGLELVKRGTYPKGGGVVKVSVKPLKTIQGFSFLERGEVKKIKGISWCENLPLHVCKRQKESAEKLLYQAGYEDVEIAVQAGKMSRSPGSGVVVWAETTNKAFIGADSLGERGKPAEKVGREAANKLLTELTLKAPLDKHMGDQVIPFMGLAQGTSQVKVTEITRHTKTNIFVTEKILKVNFEVEDDKPGLIRVKGMGAQNKFI